jgi:hypothetical protein
LIGLIDQGNPINLLILQILIKKGNSASKNANCKKAASFYSKGGELLPKRRRAFFKSSVSVFQKAASFFNNLLWRPKEIPIRI